MKAIDQQEKIIRQSIRFARKLILKNIALDFCFLINDHGELTYIDNFNSDLRSNKYLRSESFFTRLEKFCEFLLFTGKYSDYVNIYFQTDIEIASITYSNAFVVTGKLKSFYDFGFHIFAYEMMENGRLRIFRPKGAGRLEFDYDVKSEVLQLLFSHKDN